jgi:hypothetical protein
VIWQVYKAYADMDRANATMHAVTRNPAIIDGIASIDAGNTIHCILGNNESVPLRLNVRLTRIPHAATFTRYRLLVYDLPDLGETSYIDPVLLQDTIITIRDSTLDFSTPISKNGALSIILVPI